MYGPVLSYETDNKKWEFRGSFMWFGKYTASVDSTVTVSANLPFPGSATVPLTINTEMEMEYKDIDLQAKRMITGTFGILGGGITSSPINRRLNPITRLPLSQHP